MTTCRGGEAGGLWGERLSGPLRGQKASRLDCFTLRVRNDGQVTGAMTGGVAATVIARSEATKQSRRGRPSHWIAALRSQ
ncbi:MAG: hypothetical protein LBT00_08960 [Spirochaetaceae bacterium]|nr:hypothetical protein [Spirochaetaceae bacterium]